jgi:exopolysaccharide biosynthesis protein
VFSEGTMKRHFRLLWLPVVLIGYLCNGQTPVSSQAGATFSMDSITFVQIRTDSLFNSKQIISLLILRKTALNRFRVEIEYSRSDLKTTSSFGKISNAEVAMNAGFFDRDNGGSVAYVEVHDTVISRTRAPNLKWAKPDSLINGAVILTRDHNVIIQPAGSDQFYEQSKQEEAVMVAGPLLLFNSKVMKLPNMELVIDRNPRTCLCTTKESVIFITIDGRHREAEGMSLADVQKYLEKIKCIDAINLDGGGSTTMWIKDKGVVNFPSDESGERPVSNVLLIMKNDNNH